MTIYDHQRLADEVAGLTDGGLSTTAQGKRLQDLGAWLFGEVPSCEVKFQNVHNQGRSQEQDLFVVHDPSASGMPMLESLFPIECKNEASKASAAHVREFGSKIRSSGGRDGVLIAREGLSGTAGTHGHQAVRDELQQGTRIVVLTGSDLAALSSADDLVELVHSRFTELRVEQTYVTI